MSNCDKCGKPIDLHDPDVEVDLIASGYEFDCPNCDYMNTIIETGIEVQCEKCNIIFQVGEIEHAFGSGLPAFEKDVP